MTQHEKRRAAWARSTNIQSLKLSQAKAQDHVHDARTIGWVALEQSFQHDLDLINARLSALLLERYAA